MGSRCDATMRASQLNFWDKKPKETVDRQRGFRNAEYKEEENDAANKERDEAKLAPS